MRIFLAGAAGVIGRRLTPLLVLMGHEVTGTTRSAAKAGQIEASCGRPVVVDVFDAAALTRVMLEARPEIVIHQVTDLPSDPAQASAPPRRTRGCASRERAT
jgi:nucleoside-diphosphate-sugar epimerase